MKVNVPPIKSQGIKTKLVPWIESVIPANLAGKWVEPFMGTGVVGFNLAPHSALMCDTNPHLIAFYNAIADGTITAARTRAYLVDEGRQLLAHGDQHYYAIRERFNQAHAPLDFLFLSRAGFNGMIRFNRKGGYNVPFCKKPKRFAPAYITKIVNQVHWLEQLFQIKQFTFKCQSFAQTIAEATADDFIYCDPPYIGRHVDYFGGWNEENELALFESLHSTPAHFVLSTWHHNDYRANPYIETLWKPFAILTREHFYHVGASEANRSPMIEAIIANYQLRPIISEHKAEQLALFEKRTAYRTTSSGGKPKQVS